MKTRFQLYIDETGEEQGKGAGRPDHDVLREDEFYDKRQAKIPTRKKFTPRRCGPEKLKFPMRPEKALVKLTGRPTLAKAKTAFLHYAVARNLSEMGWTKQFAMSSARKELRHNLETGDWTLAFFKLHAEQYAKWPRPNFDAAVHKRRLLNILSGLGAEESRS